jgi:uncharacterized protein YbaR (Trm112 family)
MTDSIICIWSPADGHASSLVMIPAVDGTGLLRCSGCDATFLVHDGIPVMLAHDDLTDVERRLVTELRKTDKVDELCAEGELYGLS